MIIKKLLKKLGYNYFKSKNDRAIEEITPYENKLINKCLKYSMTTKVRMWSLLNSINYIYNNNIQGDFVECGVWRGGNLILYELLNQKYNLDKKVFGFDTFEGMPMPGEHDFKYNNLSAMDLYNRKVKIENNWCKSTLDEVKRNILTECSNVNVKLIKGKVENTLLVKENIPDKISILRIDTDFYESTKIELEILFPKLEKNGVLIIDDYGSYKGARKAVDEYFKKKAFLIYIDHTCRLLIKN